MAEIDRDTFLRLLLALLIAAGAFFGLAPLLLPGTFASLTGFRGDDVFIYRLAGAATFGYAVALGLGYRDGWHALRIPIAATATFNAASILACLLAIAAGGPQPIVYVILLASIVFTSGTLAFLTRPPGDLPVPDTTSEAQIAPWLIGFIGIATVAATVFGLGPLIAAGGFGKVIGLTGSDDFIYRQAGAATFGYAIGGVLQLGSRRWSEIRLLAVMALVFNGLSVIAAALEVMRAGLPIAWLILVAAIGATSGSALAIRRRGT